MADALFPHPLERPAQHSRRLLREIADVLGVDVEAFTVGPSAHLFHSDDDAAQWFLVAGEEGLPVVRQVGGRSQQTMCADEPVAAFLSRNIGTAQGDALVGLINYLLLAHMR